MKRRRNKHLRVPVLPEEKEIIENHAELTHKSVAAFLRELGLGYEVKCMLDQKAVLDLLKVNGDLGRLGGLLKMWLSNDKKMANYDKAQVEATVVQTLHKIQNSQEKILEIVKRLVP